MLDCSATALGVSPLRRLTREQYERSVRDLLGLAVDEQSLGPDEQAGPFATNIGAPLTELSTQQYMETAETLAAAAVGDLGKLLRCDPAALGNDACASQFIASFGRRVYRRPLTSIESRRYQDQYAQLVQAESFADAIRVVLQTMLQSPHYLYLVELESKQLAQDEIAPLSSHEVAARLSYFLWGSTPDAELLDAADRDELADATVLRAQAQRLFDDPRTTDTLGSFHAQWLQLQSLDALTKDAATYPSWNDGLRDAMRAETRAFVDEVYRHGDASIATLLTAPFSVIDGPLFDYYGVTQPSGFTSGQKVMLDGSERAGILTQSAFLATHAHENQSAPVKRGVTVIRNVLCATLPNPPADVLLKAPDPAPNATTRERFTLHEAEPRCAACHETIDGIGFGFEAYDGIGQHRTTDQGLPVDDNGKILGTTDINGTFQGAIALAQKLASSDDVSQCMAKQWFRYGLGRLDEKADACSLQSLTSSLAGSNKNLREMLLALTTTDAFRMRKGQAP
ncbi:MAG TPA: DUF1592 domain-containing protein [Polyangiales bacterium]|nr:DUF1592 domain-containing protein [Polyangiales bacterium]